MDAASPIASRVATRTSLSSGNPFKTAMQDFVAWFAFGLLGGWFGSRGDRDATHPPATGYRHRP